MNSSTTRTRANGRSGLLASKVGILGVEGVVIGVLLG